MKYFKISAAIFLIVSAPLFLYPQSFWEGTAAMSRYGEFPVTGFYAASGSFSINSVVDVKNPSTGKNVEVIIVDTLKDKNLFILLSKDASEKIGLRQDEIINVRVTLAETVKAAPPAESTSVKDPDRSPLAYESELLAERKAATEMVSDGEPVSSGREAEESAPADTAAESMIIVYDEKDEADEPGDEEYLSDSADSGDDPAESGFKESEIYSVVMDESEPSDPEGAEKPEDMESESGTTAAAVTAGPEKPALRESEYENRYVLLPAEPRPPVTDKPSGKAGLTEKAAGEKELPRTDYITDEKEAPVYGSLRPGNNYYLQIGAFSDKSSAEKLAAAINIEYPVVIYYDNNTYRVMAGPLRKDERGAALYNIRNSGYRDAFIRVGE